MSKRNKKTRYDKMNQHYKKDEAERMTRLKARNETRVSNAKLRAEGKANKDAHKKAKKKPVVAHPEKNAKKMAKMMKKMTLATTTGKKANDDSSASETEQEQEQDMEITQTAQSATKQIFKKKPMSRSYYQALKKSLRRRIKDGNMPDISALDKKLGNMTD